MKIASFTGPKGSGKDTSADILKELKIAKGSISFAGPLKKICMEVFNLHHTLVSDPILKEKPLTSGEIIITPKILRKINQLMMEYLDPEEFFYSPNRASVVGLEGTPLRTPREILQIIGTEWIRNRIHPDWHLQAAFSSKTLEKLDQSGLYCVTDARFVNEYQFLANKFGEDFKGFYVERPEAEERLAQATHDSERKVLEVRAVIPESNIILNDGSLEDLKKKLLALNLNSGEPKVNKKGQLSTGKFKFAKAGSKDEGSF
jgi:hypothetical protein